MARRTFMSLFESYEERVARVADGIARHVRGSAEKVTPDKVKDLANFHSRGELEGRLGGQAHAHLMKDAMKLARPAVASVNRSLGARARGQALKNFHSDLAHHINTEIGNHIPDGDPFDALQGHAERLASKHGIHDYDDYDVGDHLDKASKLNGYDGYHDQLAHTWDEYGADSTNPEHVLTYHKDDPDGQAKHDQHTKDAAMVGRITQHVERKDGTREVYKTDPFENPWR